MKTEWVLTKEAFDTLLAWLDEDRDRAGEKYEDIRRKLIKILARRGCPIAEELADETMNRVSRKVQEVAPIFVGDPALYFYGVVQNVYLEYVKKRPISKALPEPDPIEQTEATYECLERCLNRIDPASRELILEYFQDERRAKIDHRKKLAIRLGLSMNGLRMRVHRIVEALRRCVGECLLQAEAG
jgi:DNA-directed RNA polymerase specialized sigma24 family protein